MELITILYGIEVVVSVLIIIAILLQEREGGLGTMFGGASGGEGYRSKRGMELFLTRSTVIMIVIFVVNSLAIAIAGK